MLNRKESQNDTARFDNHVSQLMNNSKLSTSYVVTRQTSRGISDKCQRFDLAINFPNTRMVLEMEIPAAANAKAKGQVTNFLKILEGSGVEDSIKIQANYGNKRYSDQETLSNLRELHKSPVEKSYTIINKDLGNKIKNFKISYSPDFTKSNFYSPTKFISDVEQGTKNFYQQVVARFL